MEIKKIKSVGEYSQLRGAETLHPLINILDYQDLKFLEPASYNFGFFCIFLKETKCGDLKYGKETYDYQEKSMVFVAPGQILTVENYLPGIKPEGKVLIVHPDFLRGTALSSILTDYNFFSYSINEALHLSNKEIEMVLNMFKTIEDELKRNIDKHTKTLVISHLQLLLNYSTRFYERQFITREHVNKSVLEKFERLLNNYFSSSDPKNIGLPTVAYCAEKLHLSANYFGDLIKKETGISALEYIQGKIIDLAKEKIFDTSKSLSEIAYELGFKYPQHFTRLFKQQVGQTPVEYRSLN
ncbi:helix-turn-helix domain-containing protein [Mucilaginibacter sp. 44-25]|uniref:helix-turn-helix domain-containing protein n=1 Tax=Mucilaginibacter sp. 44-25 TaxID=1895794 RepID=UPI000965F147|nr:helix-turn-helix domain-containing protein [Mucilaginibacter sp. 44-25]OJW13209.1 MAG: AraC family transcriptional regulator [Mucilaginibacter sp. 44-25]HEK20654.1 AraC family transcriptional regulator [Bacteroidota bacterium]